MKKVLREQPIKKNGENVSLKGHHQPVCLSSFHTTKYFKISSDKFLRAFLSFWRYRNKILLWVKCIFCRGMTPLPDIKTQDAYHIRSFDQF